MTVADGPLDVRRVLVTGSRAYTNRRYVFAVLGDLEPLKVIQGGASGADALAAEWCRATGTPFVTYPYPPGTGKPGGPMRNRRMVDEERPTLCIAFPGGSGTHQCASYAESRGVLVVRLEEQDMT